MNLAVHFEIPVMDLERAIQFYEAVFDVVLERANIDGNEMALFPLHEDKAGCSGALAKGESYVPDINGTRIYLVVNDIEAAMERALLAGAVELYPITRVTENIKVAEIKDTEGNRIALHG